MILQSLCIAFVLGVSGLDEPGPVLTRWSTGTPVIGEVTTLSDQGVTMQLPQEIKRVTIPWYDVRSLNSKKSKSDEFGEYRELALNSWRAHTRLTRGDYRGAERIYNELEKIYLWTVGTQGADVSLGLLRCRLDRGDRVHAVVPFLSWLGASSDSGSSDVLTERDPVDGFDEPYQLFVDLAPIFGPHDDGSVIEAVDESVSIPDRQMALLGYYQLALDTSAHRTTSAIDELHKLRVLVRASGKRDAGLAFVDELLVAQAHPESEKRSSARKSLARRVRANQGTWIELWSRLAIGVSMMGESETELNERGVIELIHIVVRLRHLSQPMAELAAQIANEYLSRTQRTQWGNELMLEALGGSSE